MATIQKREGRAKPYRVRFRDLDGVQRSKSFAKKKEAEAFANTVEADKLRGTYIDPRAGTRPFGDFAGEWLAAQTFDPSTRQAVGIRLRVHILPTFGNLPLSSIRPSTVQAWLRGRQKECAPSTVKVLLANLSAILNAAVADGLLTANPCASSAVRAPKLERRRVVPFTSGEVDRIVRAHPDRYRAVPVVPAGCGLRQGEVFGLAVEDVDFLRQVVHIRRQVKLIGAKPVFAPPKGGAEREVPLPETVAVTLAEHLRAWPAVEVTLPWRDIDGPAHTARLLFTSRQAGHIDRNHYNPYVWKPALREAGVEPTRDHGMHALRHHYASVLLDGGVSIRALAQYLGHADPGFTLRTYTHLMPDSEDRARSVVDAALGPRVAQMWPGGEQDVR